MEFIRRRVSRLKNYFINELFWIINSKKHISSKVSEDENILLKQYKEYVNRNRDITYTIEKVKIPECVEKHKWVGAQEYRNKVYAIPNDMSSVLCIDKEYKIELIGDLEQGLFKWTGGAIWNEMLYSFSRSSNNLLKLNLNNNELSYIELNEKYDAEHHYGGICTNEGIIYQPPRNTDHILVWDLKKNKTRKIYLINPLFGMKFRYCGSYIHPNGFAYFFPESLGKIIKLNIKTEEWCLIGKEMVTTVFDAKMGEDGNIYGFSAKNSGILKINTKTDECEMIHADIQFGSYGTKLGVNGKLYSVPGDSQYVWEFDIKTDKVKAIYDLKDQTYAKFAGGTACRNGDIMLVPAEDIYVLILKASRRIQMIEEVLYNTIWRDNY